MTADGADAVAVSAGLADQPGARHASKSGLRRAESAG